MSNEVLDHLVELVGEGKISNLCVAPRSMLPITDERGYISHLPSLEWRVSFDVEVLQHHV